MFSKSQQTFGLPFWIPALSGRNDHQNLFWPKGGVERPASKNGILRNLWTDD
jgi:hypothetical protein